MAATAPQQTTILTITTLHRHIASLLRPRGRSPTRAEYTQALALADEALELATGSSVTPRHDDEAYKHLVQTCHAFQAFCLDPLARASERADAWERERSVAPANTPLMRVTWAPEG
ncbi:hypothetical protein F4775DRAFT_589335 [Biscogniauxia sp. FL1348]|nr:hypothetical protein F4775DRAFT_589335 [Biscogniauxia sp. FL1348]